MSDRDRTELPEKVKPHRPLLAVAAGYALVGIGGAVSWLLRRVRHRLSPVERAVREEMGRGREPVKDPAPTPDRVRARREERRRREAEEARR